MTGRRLSLRRRVGLAYTLLGFALSVLFAAATIYLTEAYEEIVVTEILEGQAQDYARRLAHDPATPLPSTHRLSGYLRRSDGSGDVPADMFDLPPGIHESDDENEDGRHIGVFDTPQGRLFFVIDLGQIEALERYLAGFLVAVVLLGTAAGGWIGWLLAGSTIEPVRKLAQAVDALSTRPHVTALAQHATDDELGRLAAAIDAYQARLVDADASERAFFADASHELRTPMAVVHGVAEVLLDEPSADPVTRRRLARLDRGVGELTDLIDVLFGLARRTAYTPISVDAATLLRDAVAPLRAAHAGALTIDIDATGSLHVPQSQALLVLRGLLRRLLPPAPNGVLRLAAIDTRLTLDYRADAAAAAPPPHDTRSDRGLGLTLVGRFAEHLGWHVAETASDPLHRGVTLQLPASARS
ncbi:MAG TPA: histidine kinase dimerization/phospho-acceptor domain-containing protein [Tahibacter sp.]|nr:histidine kinase dimerization/phospho-acceptor domain-containing protein [Tahibacter sp.]